MNAARTEQEVAAEIVARAWRLGCTVLISPTSFVMADGQKVGGYFDDAAEVPTLLVAQYRKDGRWLEILAHEYCHVTQWFEQCDAWRAASDIPNFFEWIAGEPMRNVRDTIRRTQLMEADNERRTLRLLQEIGAPFDAKRYARSANAYIHFHNVVADKRKWYKEPASLYAPEILAHCNDTIDTRIEKTPRALYDAIVKHAIE